MVEPKKFQSWLSSESAGKFSWPNLCLARDFLADYGLEYCQDYNGYLATFADDDTIVVLIRQESGGWRIATVDGDRLSQKQLRELFGI